MGRQAFPVFTPDQAVAATVAERATSLDGIDTRALDSGALATITGGTLVGSLYWLDVDSTEPPNGTSVVAPLTGPGRWLQIATGGAGGESSTLLIFDGERAGLTWDGPVTSQVRFFDVTAGTPGTQVGADQTEAPFGVQTANLSAEDRRLYDVEVDDVVVGRITVYVLNQMAHVATIGTATKTVSSSFLDVVTTDPINADTELALVGIASDNITTTYNKAGDILSVQADPTGTPIDFLESWQRTAGFSADGSPPFGVTAGAFWLAPGTTIPAGTTIRITFSGALSVATAVIEKYSKDSRTTIMAGTASLALSPLDTRIGTPPVSPGLAQDVAEYIWNYHVGREGGAISQFTYDAAWTSNTQATDGSGFDGIGNRGARRIATGLASGDPAPQDPDANTEYSGGITKYAATIDGRTAPSP